jgi:hypothetical protein
MWRARIEQSPLKRVPVDDEMKEMGETLARPVLVVRYGRMLLFVLFRQPLVDLPHVLIVVKLHTY